VSNDTGSYNEALPAAAAWGMVHLQVETDAQNLVRALKDGSFDRTPEGVIYRDIRTTFI
jgi:hypothetical protein